MVSTDVNNILLRSVIVVFNHFNDLNSPTLSTYRFSITKIIHQKTLIHLLTDIYLLIDDSSNIQIYLNVLCGS